jgi:hypothetical protein
MIQLKKAGLVADREDVERLRRQFEQSHWVKLPALLDTQLLSLALSYIEQGQWHETASGFYSESTLDPGPGISLMQFVSNSPRFLEVIGEIAACGALTWFQGRIYSRGPGHTDRWHNDSVEGRTIAMSVNLSPRGFEGGVFQMREVESHRMLADIANTGLADAILFRVSDDLQHRVTEVRAGDPKRAFAGWFGGTQQNMREQLISQKSDTHKRLEF